MTEEEKQAIGNRLRSFGEQKFGKLKDFAEALGMHPSALQSTYLRGRSVPGAEILVKLINLGCDIPWLLLGSVNNHVVNDSPIEYETSYNLSLRAQNQLLKQGIEQMSQVLDSIRVGMGTIDTTVPAGNSTLVAWTMMRIHHEEYLKYSKMYEEQIKEQELSKSPV